MDTFAEGLYAGKVVVVTGGGSGIGKTVAQYIGLLGGKIAICGRRNDVLQKTCKELHEEHGIAIIGKTCDIRDEAAVNEFVQFVVGKFGTIDVLVSNAGGQFTIESKNLTPKGFHAVINNNLVGTWTFIYTIANKVFIPQKKGRIVNVIAEIYRGFPGMIHTGAARAGVSNITKTLAVEWAEYNISVNAVAPGFIKSSGTNQYHPKMMQKAIAAVPIKRLGTTEEVAKLVVFLGSDKAAAYINGATYYIDGGSSLWGDLWEIGPNADKSFWKLPRSKPKL
eukprot:TRINITY_DN88_c0_g1_i1.p1 TRINITY_DN88_c0_g1~~TRINITY_DN88_c0_g1_i1.p1  ORF type:complete len:280 (-),score=48.81 TRINITY_DN88_c0_g1_i1:91-930(-)